MKLLNLEEYNDYELVYLAKEQHEIAYEILQMKYEPIIVSLAKRFSQFYTKIGLDIYDYVLEGKTALDKAIYNFDDSYGNIFFTHAINYIRYHLYLLVKNAKKDICLNNSIPWTESLDHICSNEVVDNVETRDTLKNILIGLTILERKILILKIKGYSYDDIANKLQLERKKVDNVLFKIRRRLRKIRKE